MDLKVDVKRLRGDESDTRLGCCFTNLWRAMHVDVQRTILDAQSLVIAARDSVKPLLSS